MKTAHIIIAGSLILVLGFFVALKESGLFHLATHLFPLVKESVVLDLTGKKYEAYKYHKTPCENKNFTTTKEMILLENKDASMQKSFYSLSRYSLDDYEEYRKQEGISLSYDGKSMKFLSPKSRLHKEIKLYDINSTFKVLSYYMHVVNGAFGGSMAAYLVKTEDNLIAWIPSFEFDSNSCQPTTEYFNSKEYHETIEANYAKEQVELPKPTKPFSSQDETYAISKSYYKKLKEIRDEKQRRLREKREKSELEYKAKRKKERQESIKKKIKGGEMRSILFLGKVEMDLIDDEIISLLKGIKKETHGYLVAQEMLERIRYLRKYPNADITSVSTKIDPDTKEAVVTMVALNKSTWSELMRAIASHDREKIDAILSTNPNLNHKTNNNSTAIFFAAHENDTKTLKKLIDLGMDINHQNNFFYTPLHVALATNAYEAAQILINQGAKVDLFAQNSYKKTPFMLEIWKKDINYTILDALVKNGANVNKRYKDEPTLLMVASRSCDDELVEYLLKKGANSHVKNEFGKNSIQIWQETCTHEVKFDMQK